MALFLLRCYQIGISITELDYLEYGEILDMFIEASNDHADYDYKATQDDMDGF